MNRMLRSLIIWLYHRFNRIPPKYVLGILIWRLPDSALRELEKQERRVLKDGGYTQE